MNLNQITKCMQYYCILNCFIDFRNEKSIMQMNGNKFYLYILLISPNTSAIVPELMQYLFLFTDTLKDFKLNHKKIISSVSISLLFGNNEHRYVSKTCSKFCIKKSNVRATVYQI